MTASLKNLIEQKVNELDTRESVERYLTTIQDGLAFYKEQFSKMPEGKVRAFSVNAFIEENLNDDKAKRPARWEEVKCRRGCSHCCHNVVVATEDEADLLAFAMIEGQIEIDRDLLKRQSEFAGTDHEWFLQPKSENRCVFLSEDNSCRVYEYRPASCRKYFVVTDPSQCDDRVGAQTVGVIADVQIELAYSAAMDIDHSKVDRLPNVLRKRLEAENV